MAVTYLKPGAPFVFSTKWGFGGSAQGDRPARNQPDVLVPNAFGDTGYPESLQGRALAKERDGFATGGRVQAGKTRNDLSTQDAAAAPGFTPYSEYMSDAPVAPTNLGNAKGGRIRKAFGGGMPGRPATLPAPSPPPAQGAMSRATVTMPVGDAAQAVKGTFQAGRAVGAKQAMSSLAGAVRNGAGRAPMVGPPGAATALGAAPPPQVARTGVPAMKRGGRARFDDGGAVDIADNGMAKGGHWIAGAVKNNGALHRSLGVPPGDKIPAGKLAKAAHSADPTLRRRAVLAETLKGFHKKG